MGKFQDLIYFLTIKPKIRRLKKLLVEAEIHPCGSRYVCNPPSLFTDVDFLVYSEHCVKARLLLAGYEEADVTHYSGPPAKWEKRSVWRKGVVNLIVTASPRFRDRWNTATHICRSHNLLNKYHRIVVYEALREIWAEEDEFLLKTNFPVELKQTLKNFCGPYGEAMVKAYRAKHDL